jgi:hypothetical protein
MLLDCFSPVLSGDGQRSVDPRMVNFPYPVSSNANQSTTWFLKFEAYEALKRIRAAHDDIRGSTGRISRQVLWDRCKPGNAGQHLGGNGLDGA